MKKVLISIIMMILIITSCYNFVIAINGPALAKKFSGANPDDTGDVARNIIGFVLATVRAAGVIVAVAILMIIGIKYIIASAGERADIKKYAIKYIIGALILFSASGLVSVVSKIIEKSVVVE